MPTVLICCDKFKGSASSRAVAAALGRGLESSGCSVVALPLADGGDGTLEVFDDLGYHRRAVVVRGADGERVAAEYVLESASVDGGRTAVIEIARACGLDMVSVDGEVPGPESARQAGSWGVGELIIAALDEGVGRIILGLGGSATTDAGFGMAQALGVVFLDSAGAPVTRTGDLADVAAVDLDRLDHRLTEVEVVVASDVQNPLYGLDGAAVVYGPQKGLAPEDIDEVDSVIRGFAAVVEDALGTSGMAAQPGAGAAGGLGFMALGLLGAQMRSGVGLVLEETGFVGALGTADLVITGEGRLDAQTLSGKGPAGVAERAQESDVPVVAVCGQNQLDAGQASALFASVHSLADYEPDVEKCFRDPLPILERIGFEIGAGLTRGP
ncbi:glycerate kinase [Corynebacterium sp.]|uniref:glycerate kinase n=1 Tax=Corynebacterium sp. TaxID=1720 RepID=UPI0028AA7D5F|nr:glycerate kinase [Corynebacterium sp.]